jgi:hypothetical protein
MFGNWEEAAKKCIVRAIEFTFVRGEKMNEVKLFTYEFVPNHISGGCVH